MLERLHEEHGEVYSEQNGKKMWPWMITIKIQTRHCQCHYSGIHIPCPGVFWPSSQNFLDIELKFCVFS